MYIARMIARIGRHAVASAPRFRLVAIAMAAALTCTLLVNIAPKAAFALQSKPPTDWSFYWLTSNPNYQDPVTHQNMAGELGCNQGHFDKSFSPPVNSEVVLDFGGQLGDSSGAYLIDQESITNAEIESIAEEFAYQYWYCTGTDQTSVLKLGIGTNNSYSDVDYNGGYAWSQLVGAIESFVKNNGYSSQVTVVGASDIEPGWWNHTDTENWVNGYAAYGGSYLDFDSADECSTDQYNDQPCGSTGWSQYDVWYVSWGAPPAFPTPEIYYNALALQWTMISLYGANYHNEAVYYQGPWDEYDLDSSTYTSTQAWSTFWNDLNSYSQTAQNMFFSAEIHDEPT